MTRIEGNIVSFERYKKDLREHRKLELSRPVAEELFFFLGAWARTKNERLALYAKFNGISDPQNKVVTLSVSRHEINTMADLLKSTYEDPRIVDMPDKSVFVALGIVDEVFVKDGGVKSYLFKGKMEQIDLEIGQRYEQNS